MNGADWTALTDAINALGVVGLLALAVWGKLNGWWYTGAEYRAALERLVDVERDLAIVRGKYEELLATVGELKGKVYSGQPVSLP